MIKKKKILFFEYKQIPNLVEDYRYIIFLFFFFTEF